MKSYGVAIQMKPLQQYFNEILFVLYVVLTFESLQEINPMVQPLTWKLFRSTFTWYKMKVASFDEFWCLVKKLDIKQIRVIQESTKEDESTGDAQKQYSEFVPVFSLSLSRNAAIKAVLFAYNLSFSSRIADSSTIPTLERGKKRPWKPDYQDVTLMYHGSMNFISNWM